MKLSDLIKGCQNDDENCLNMLLQRYSRMIAIYFTRRNIPQEEIRSLCSDVFLHLWRFKYQFVIEDEHTDSDIEKHFINWLYLIAHWQVRTYFKGKQTIKEKFNNKFLIVTFCGADKYEMPLLMLIFQCHPKRIRQKQWHYKISISSTEL